MSIKKAFLTLSIRHQITIYIIVISIFCLFSIITLFSLYSHIIIGMQSKRRKEYYFQKHKQIIDSEIRFQSFLLYLYEQIIKGFNSQLYYYGLYNDKSDSALDAQVDLIKYFDETTEEDYDPNSEEDKKIYFLLSFSNDKYIDYNIFLYLASIYPSINNKLNCMRNFSIPFLENNKSIINEYVFIFLAQKNLFSINRTKIEEIKNKTKQNYTGYYSDLIDTYTNKYKNYMNDYKRGKLNFIDIFFENKLYLFSNYINETYLKEYFNGNIREYLNNISYNFQFIDYSNGNIFITDNGNPKTAHFLGQNTIISDYISFLFSKIQKSFDINVIPIYHENNTIMSANLCYAFLYKQIMILNLTSDKDIFDKVKLNAIYNSLKEGKSNISDCILNEKYKNDISQNIQKILNIKFSKFYSMKNTREYSLFKLSESFIGKDYYCTKYTFPDFTSILNFKPTFFTLEQLDLYCFKSFYESQYYYDNMMGFFNNNEYLIILCLLYIWLLVSIYIIYKSRKLFAEIVDPINQLNEIINKMEIKNENMLEYEADDSINDLFKLSNELLLGKYRQKMAHDSDIDKINNDQNDGNKNINDLGNLKINRKLIEEMVENKNEYNFLEEEIKTFNINEKQNNYIDNKKQNKEQRKTTIIQTKDFGDNDNYDYNQINDIQRNIKKTNSINRAISLLNKKLSYDVNLLLKENLISTENHSEEDILENEVLVNYKQLYDIVDFTFNYEIKYDNKYVSKNTKLLYKNNINNYNRYHRVQSRKKLIENLDDNKLKNESNDRLIKANEIITIQEFDKSVISTYKTKDMLFLWYEEAKFFKSEPFLQTNHVKELNNLCNIIIGNDNKKNNNKQYINSDINKNNSLNLRKTTFSSKINKETKKSNNLTEKIRKLKTHIIK